MARFRFRAVAGSGEVVEGEIEARDEAQVVEQLRGQGHLPLAATPVGGDQDTAGAGLLAWLNRPILGRARIGTKEVAVMTRELATLLGAGMTLDQSLRLMVDLGDNEAMRRLMRDLLEAIQGGSSLGDALARHDQVFSRAYVSMVRAGEAGGALDEVLGRLAVQLDRAEELREQVRSALVYPILLLIMAGLSLIILLTVVLPQFRSLFESAEAELPLLTQVVIAVGDFVQQTWWLLLLGVVALALYLRRALRQPASRAVIDRWLLRTPLLGELALRLDTARFTRTLATLLANGVPLLSALSIVRETLANATLRDAIGEAAGEVQAGQGLAQTLERTGRFPKLALQLIGVGERSGQLEGMLLKVADIYDREVRGTIDRLMALLVPGLTITLGLVIALIIGAILSAILQAYQLPL